MDMNNILDNIKELIECSRLTPDEIKRALTREMNLKNVDRSVARNTSRKEFLKKLTKLVDSVLRKDRDGKYIYDGMQSLQGLQKKFKEIMQEYTGFGKLSRTSVWRAKNELNEYIKSRAPDNDYRIRQVINFERNSGLY